MIPPRWYSRKTRVRKVGGKWCTETWPSPWDFMRVEWASWAQAMRQACEFERCTAENVFAATWDRPR